MRSSLLIILLLSITVGQFSTTALVLVRHRRGRRYAEMLRRARDDEGTTGLTHLMVPLEHDNSSITFTRVGRDEVRYEGHLYDVVFEELRGDTLHMWGYWDRDEEAAVAQLAQSVEVVALASELGSTPPHLKNPPLFYHTHVPAALRPPVPGRTRYARQQMRATAAPFDDVPHAPPRA